MQARAAHVGAAGEDIEKPPPARHERNDIPSGTLWTTVFRNSLSLADIR